MKRFPPPVEAPYGMPLNTFTPPSTTTPRTFPADVSATALPRSAALSTVSHGVNCAPAIARPACLMKRRRLEMYGMFASFGHQKQLTSYQRLLNRRDRRVFFKKETPRALRAQRFHRRLSRAIRWVSNCVCRFDPVKGLLAETHMGLSPQPARGAAIF